MLLQQVPKRGLQYHSFIHSLQSIRMRASRRGRLGTECGGRRDRRACCDSTAQTPWTAQTQPPTSQQYRSVLFTVLSFGLPAALREHPSWQS